MCQEGTRIETTIEWVTEWVLEERVKTVYRWKTVRKRVKVNGRWVWVISRVRVKVKIIYTVRVPIQVQRPVSREVPNFIICRDWLFKTQALHVMIHEAMHAAGWAESLDEGSTDCLAMRNLDWFTWRLGAIPDFAREVQADEWYQYSQHQYYLPDCPRD
jgi:hypothetical protein